MTIKIEQMISTIREEIKKIKEIFSVRVEGSTPKEQMNKFLVSLRKIEETIGQKKEENIIVISLDDIKKMPTQKRLEFVTELFNKLGFEQVEENQND